MEVGARQVPLTTGNCVLVLRCALCILANLTTNELIGRRRYGFLKARPPDPPGCQFWPHGNVCSHPAVA